MESTVNLCASVDGSCRFSKKRKKKKPDSPTAVIVLKLLHNLLWLSCSVPSAAILQARWNEIIANELLLLGRKKGNDVQ